MPPEEERDIAGLRWWSGLVRDCCDQTGHASVAGEEKSDPDRVGLGRSYWAGAGTGAAGATGGGAP